MYKKPYMINVLTEKDVVKPFQSNEFVLAFMSQFSKLRA